ncbi:unnamed protein product [Closterium sp. NIES-54]
MLHLVLRSRVPSPPILPQPPDSSLTVLHDPLSDYLRASRPIVSRVLSALVTHPSATLSSVSALITKVAGFASSDRLYYAAHLVSGPAHSPSSGGALVFPLEVLEDRQFEFGFRAAAVPHLCAMLLALEGDPDALNIPIPRTHAEAVSRPWALYWIATEDAEMTSYRSTGTYVDAVPPLQANVVSAMWLYKVKRPPGAPPVFKARYVARGFSQREGVEIFQTFAPTPNMTTLWQLRRLVYGLCQPPREWHNTLHTTLAALDFFLSSADPSLFVRRGSTPFFVLVYVDDLVFATPDRRALASVKEELQRRHTCIDLGELQCYLGQQITMDRTARTITLTQSHMVEQILTRFRFPFSKVQPTPLALDHGLMAPPSDEPFESSGSYPELVGCLIGGSGGSEGNGGGRGGGSGGSGGGSGGFGGGGGGSDGGWGGGGGGSGSGRGGSGGGRVGAAQRGGSGGGQRQQQQRRSETPTPQQLREWFAQRGASGGSVRCLYVIRTEFGDEAERPRWQELHRSGVNIFAREYDAIIAAMYALSVIAEGDYFLCVPPDPGTEAAALGASESALPGTTPAEALHTFTLDSGRHQATFTYRPGSSLYTLTTEPPQVAASSQVSASGQVAAPCSCRLLSHQNLLWHHRLGHPSLPRLRGMHSRLLVSGLPRSLPPLPPTPALPCLPCVEVRQHTAPHSSLFPPSSALLQTLHVDVWGLARVSGQGSKRYFLLVVEDYTRYTMVFPLHSKGQVPDVLIPWIRTARLQLHERFREDLPVLRLHSDRGDKLSSRAIFCDFLGFPPDVHGWKFYHPTSRRVLPSQDGAVPSGVSQVDPLPLTVPIKVAVDSGATRGAASGGAKPASAEPGVAGPEGAKPRGTESEGAESGGAEPEGVEPRGAESEGAESGGAEPRGTACAGGPSGASP